MVFRRFILKNFKRGKRKLDTNEVKKSNAQKTNRKNGRSIKSLLKKSIKRCNLIRSENTAIF